METYKISRLSTTQIKITVDVKSLGKSGTYIGYAGKNGNLDIKKFTWGHLFEEVDCGKSKDIHGGYLIVSTDIIFPIDVNEEDWKIMYTLEGGVFGKQVFIREGDKETIDYRQIFFLETADDAENNVMTLLNKKIKK